MAAINKLKDYLDVVNDLQSLKHEHDENMQGLMKLLKGFDDQSLDIENRLNRIISGWSNENQRKALVGVARDLNRELPRFRLSMRSAGSQFDSARDFLYKVEDRLGAFPESERSEARKYIADSLSRIKQVSDRYGDTIGKYDYAIKLYLNALGDEAKINTIMIATGIGTVTAPIVGAYNGFREGRIMIGTFRGMIAPLLLLSNLFGRAVSAIGSRLKNVSKSAWEAGSSVFN